MPDYKLRTLDILKYGYKQGMVAGFNLWLNNLTGGKLIRTLIKGAGRLKMRRNTSDVEAFKQVFIWEEYHYPVKGEVRVIIDAGANIGCSVLYFAQQYPEAFIVAIEPEQENFEILTANTKDNSRIKSLALGIWSKKCELIIEDKRAESWNFTLREANTGEKGIPSLSIMDILNQFNLEQVDILKLDIEGAEREIFSNDHYREWLPRVRYLFIETHDFMYPTCARITTGAIFQYNFSLFTCGENLLFINNDRVH